MVKVKNIYKRFRQIILYGLIGALSASIDFGIFTILHFLGLAYLLANAIGVHIGIFCSFLLNRQFNFKVKDKTERRFLFFYSIGLIGLLLSSVLLKLLIEYFDWNEIYAKLLSIIVVAVVQFLLNKYITFKK